MVVASSSYFSGSTETFRVFPDAMKVNGLLSARAGSPSKEITDLCTTLESSGIPYIYMG
jgi:hypothetical protein